MSGSLFGWLGDLFGGASAAGDAAAATSALTSGASAASLPASADLFGGGPVLGSAAQTGIVPGGEFSAFDQPSMLDQIGGGAGKLSDALKNLQGPKSPAGQSPNFLAGGQPSQGHGNPQALAPLVSVLQQRQDALLQAQQQGQAPPQYRTIGLLGF